MFNIHFTIWLIIGQAFSLVDCIFVIASGRAKSKKKLLLLQMGDCLFGCLAALFLGGFSGSSTAIIAGIRDILIYNGKSSKVLTIIFCVSLLITGLLVNSNGLVGLLPIAASLEYTLVLFNKKARLITIKKAFLLNIIGWELFYLAILAIPSIIMNAFQIFFLIYELYFNKINKYS